MHRIRSSAFSLIVLAGGAAQAANIQSVVATPTATPQGQVQITVTKAGAGNCGARLLLGDGEIIAPFGFGTNPRTFTHTYAQPGSYTVTAQPRKKGNLGKCGGSAKTANVTVSSGGATSGRGVAAPATSERAPLKPVPVPVQAAPDEDRSLQGFRSVDVTPFATFAEVRVKLTFRADTITLTATPQVTGNASPVSTSTTNTSGGKLTLLGLTPARTYSYEVVTTGDVNIARTGTFTTRNRTVKLVVEEYHAVDDGDDTSDGDFKFTFSQPGLPSMTISHVIGTGDSVHANDELLFRKVQKDPFRLTVKVRESDEGSPTTSGSEIEQWRDFSLSGIGEPGGGKIPFQWDVNQTAGQNPFRVLIKGHLRVSFSQ